MNQSKRNLYRVAVIRCLRADKSGTFGFHLLVAISWCRPVIRDHPIASRLARLVVTVFVGVLILGGSVTVGFATVACAVVRNSESITAFPEPAYAEIEVTLFHFFLRECEELTAMSLVAGIVTSNETLLGNKVVQMIFRQTLVEDGRGTGSHTSTTDRGKDVWEEMVTSGGCGAKDVFSFDG